MKGKRIILLLSAAALCSTAMNGLVLNVNAETITNASADFTSDCGDFVIESSDESYPLALSTKYPGWLDVGNGYGTVTIPDEELAGQTDKVNVSFEVAYGLLTKKYYYHTITDSNGTELVNWSYSPYEGRIASDILGEESGLSLIPDIYTSSKTPAADKSAVYNYEFDFAAKTVTLTLHNNANDKDAVYTADLPADVNNVKTLKIGSDYNNTERQCIIDNISITTTEGEQDLIPYTINYMLDDTVLKTKTALAKAGTVITAKSSIIVNDMVYYTEDETAPSMTVTEGEENILNVPMYSDIGSEDEIVINVNDETHFSQTGWTISSQQGYGGISTYYSMSANSVATYKPALAKSGVYEVLVYKISEKGANPQNYQVYHNGQFHSKALNFSGNEQGWMSLGEYEFAANSQEYVKIATIDRQIARISAVKFLLKEEKEVYPSLIIDTEDTEHYSEKGVWSESYAIGQYGESITRYAGSVENGEDAEASWMPKFETPQNANIKVWVNTSVLDKQVYQIQHSGKISYREVSADDIDTGEGWFDLGTFLFSSPEDCIKVIGKDICADAVYITSLPDEVFNTDNTLDILNISSAGDINIPVNPNKTEYNITLPDKQAVITPYASNKNAVVTVNGTEIAAGGNTGELMLNVGENKITVTVTVNSETKIYTINAYVPELGVANREIKSKYSTITSLVSGDITSSVTVVNNTDTAKTILAAASLTEGEKTISLSIDTKEIAAGEKADFENTVTVPDGNLTDYSVKSYVWNEMKPIADAVTVEPKKEIAVQREYYFAPQSGEMTGNNGVGDLKKMKYGGMIHFVYCGDGANATIYADGTAPGDINELANGFDVEAFADKLVDFGVEYEILTAWHAKLNPLFPSEITKKYRGSEHTSERDLIGELIDALNERGIKPILYTHNLDSQSFTAEDKASVGWYAGGLIQLDDYGDYIFGLYKELLDRYSSRLAGVMIDEAGGNYRPNSKAVDYNRLVGLIKSYNPNLVVLQNDFIPLYNADVGIYESYKLGMADDSTLENWIASSSHMCLDHYGYNWFAVRKSDERGYRKGTYVFGDESSIAPCADETYKYIVMQAGCGNAGGTSINIGPYVTGSDFEADIENILDAVGERIKPVKETILGTYASTSYPFPDKGKIDSTTWGAATQSIDGTKEYIHVLKPQSGNTLTLPAPADGKKFASAKLYKNGNEVKLEQNGSNVVLTLGDDDSWDALDTIIELTVDLKYGSEALNAKFDALDAADYTEESYNALKSAMDDLNSSMTEENYKAASIKMSELVYSYRYWLKDALSDDYVSVDGRLGGINDPVTPYSKEAAIAVREKAVNLINNGGTEKEYADMRIELINAYSAVVRTHYLKTILESNELLDKNLYTQESWNSFITEYKSGMKMMNDNNGTYIQRDIDSQVMKINAAKSKLVVK